MAGDPPRARRRLLDLEAPRIEEFPGGRGARPPGAPWPSTDVALPERNGAQRQRALIDGGATPARGVRGVRARDHGTTYAGGAHSR